MRGAAWALAVVMGSAATAMAAEVKLDATPAASEEEFSPQELARLSAVIDQIEETNRQIDARFNGIMAELQIVKVRASIKRPREEEH